MGVESFLKIGNTFEHITPAIRAVVDKDYLEGAIVWKVGNGCILSTKHLDLIDQLWAYIIDGMLALVARGEFECYFPDQPLLLKFVATPDGKVEITVGDDVTVIDRGLFFTSLICGARSFFEALCGLLPELRESWEMELARLDGIVWSHK